MTPNRPSTPTTEVLAPTSETSAQWAVQSPAKRFRDIRGPVGSYETGPTNSMVDVNGFRVGQTTVTDGSTTFSGATAIVVDGARPSHPLRAGMFVGNGHGKFVGATQLTELGQLETPIVLTSTLSAFRAADAVVTWVLEDCEPTATSINPVVAEINDLWLSQGDRRPVTPDNVLEAIRLASSAPVEMGNVGGGTGACALGFKGGIGSSSRIVGDVAIGVLVQANMSGFLRAGGVFVDPAEFGYAPAGPETEVGSCVVIVGVDAPYDSGVLRRIATRAVFALARVGARFSPGSGDYGVAVSSSQTTAVSPSNEELTAVFEATMDAVEEAILDALLAATSVETTNGRTAHALPHGAVGFHHEA